MPIIETAYLYFTRFAYCVGVFAQYMHTARGLHTATKFSAEKKKRHFFHTADLPTQYANRVSSLSAWNIYIRLDCSSRN